MITQSQAYNHPDLPGVAVMPLGEEKLQAGKSQQVLVTVAPGVVIPLHRHNYDAAMFVVAGKATVLAEDPDINGVEVRVGSRVFFQKDKDHGFRAGLDGMSFISTNGGIVDADPANWSLQFAN